MNDITTPRCPVCQGRCERGGWRIRPNGDVVANMACHGFQIVSISTPGQRGRLARQHLASQAARPMPVSPIITVDVDEDASPLVPALTE